MNNSPIWIEAGILFDFHCITKGAIFPAGDAEQDVSYCAAQKGLLFHHQTTANPQRLDKKSMIYPHLSHHIINTLSHQKDADIHLWEKDDLFTIKELVRDSKWTTFST